MTSREGYDAYTLYLGIKLHFYSEDYNFIRYNGKVKADINSFLKRKDKYHFGKLFKTYKQELQDFYIANLLLKDQWVGDLLENESDKVYKDWKKRNQKLSYLFETEVNDSLTAAKDINKLIQVKGGQHPILLKRYLAKQVSPETICIMDEIIGFTEQWDKLIQERVVYPEVHTKLNKYKSFVTFNKDKYKRKLIDLCST